MTLTVNVTRDHINRGKRNSANCCPIALALNEQHPCKGGWRVSSLYVRPVSVLNRGIELPHKAMHFVARFDNEEEVAPFSFTIIAPQEVDTSIAPEEAQ